MIARDSRSDREVNEQARHPDHRRWIGGRSARWSVIERPGAAAPSAAATTVPTAVAEAAEASAVTAAEEVLEAAEDFEAVVVAGANGTVGRFRSGGDFPDARGRRLTWGGIEHELDAIETAARASLVLADNENHNQLSSRSCCRSRGTHNFRVIIISANVFRTMPEISC